MGNPSTKFRKHVISGDEYGAMQIYQTSPDIKKKLDINQSVDENHNTLLHFASKWGLKHLLKIFLIDLNGNPNKCNLRNENALMLTCQLPLNASRKEDRRYSCAQLILQWKGDSLVGRMEHIDLKAQDVHGNTALHISAASGLKRVVELLVSHGAPLFTENLSRLTACDVASNYDIAIFLEARMLFSDVSTETKKSENAFYRLIPENESLSSVSSDEAISLQCQDLQEAKDMLVVETADMLHVPLFTAESLLRDNEWSREMLLEKWMVDPAVCFESMGLQTPFLALRQKNSNIPSTLEYLQEPSVFKCQELKISSSHQEPKTIQQSASNEDDSSSHTCGICLDSLNHSNAVKIPCEHLFCRECWSRYLTLKILEGSQSVTCPALSCSILVPVELIETLVDRETARKYLHFDLNMFVSTNPSIQWCPKASCGRAIKLLVKEHNKTQAGAQFMVRAPSFSHAVDCGNGHFFCWDCLGEAHAPSSCGHWNQWQAKIAETKPEELKFEKNESEDAANCFWLVTNCKPCPNCKSPIQKNEGCNHIKCSKCKNDFCWVCLEAWKKHSSATGGYFRCNRYEATNKADEKQDSLITEAGQRNKQLKELNRFIHYYTRYKNHDNSRLLEEQFLKSAHRKMELLAASMPAARSPVSGNSNLNTISCANRPTNDRIPACFRFIKEGLQELVKARRILCGSYVFGYYLEDNGYNKTIFEFVQNEFETCTEKLSGMVARTCLRSPRAKIVEMIKKVRHKRHDFMQAVSKGLIPPETPPALRRRIRRRRFPGVMGIDPVENEQITEAIAASLRQLDPNNPWVRDSNGKHTNLTAIYDWPDANSDEEDSDINQDLTVSLLGICDRVGCGRARARNPRTGKVHNFCSLRCSRSESFNQPALTTSDLTMDLLIALEMSRLQLIEDEVNKQHRDQPQSIRTDGSTLVTSEEAQFRLAIHLSLEEANTPNVEVYQSDLVEGASSNRHSIRSMQETKSDNNYFNSEEKESILDSNVDLVKMYNLQHGHWKSESAISSAVPSSRRIKSVCNIQIGIRSSSLDFEINGSSRKNLRYCNPSNSRLFATVGAVTADAAGRAIDQDQNPSLIEPSSSQSCERLHF